MVSLRHGAASRFGGFATWEEYVDACNPMARFRAIDARCRLLVINANDDQVWVLSYAWQYVGHCGLLRRRAGQGRAGRQTTLSRHTPSSSAWVLHGAGCAAFQQCVERCIHRRSACRATSRTTRPSSASSRTRQAPLGHAIVLVRSSPLAAVATTSRDRATWDASSCGHLPAVSVLNPTRVGGTDRLRRVCSVAWRAGAALDAAWRSRVLL